MVSMSLSGPPVPLPLRRSRMLVMAMTPTSPQKHHMSLQTASGVPMMAVLVPPLAYLVALAQEAVVLAVIPGEMRTDLSLPSSTARSGADESQEMV